MTARAAPLHLDRQGWIMMLALAVLWGGSFFFYKVLVAVLPPFTVVIGRVGLASVLLAAWVLLRGGSLRHDRQAWVQFTVLGLLNNVLPFSLIVWGETHVTSGTAAILNATTPMFTLVVAHFALHDEPLTRLRLAGVAAALVAVFVLVGPDTGAGPAALPGAAACLGASLSYAFAGVYGRRLRGISPIDVATGQVIASTALLAPLVVLIDRPWLLPMPGAGVWAALAGLAVLSTVFAYILYFALIARSGAGNAAMVTLLLPFAALALGALFLGEAVPLRALGALALIGFGFVLIDGRLPALVMRRTKPLTG